MFYDGARYPIPADRTQFISSTEIEVCVYLRYGGEWCAQIENPNCKSNVYCFPVGFEITSLEPPCPPVSPNKQEVIIRGTGFVAKSELYFGRADTCEDCKPIWPIPHDRRQVVGTTEIRAQVYLNQPGKWCVQVKNPGGESNIFCFDVCAELTITAIEPTPPWSSRDQQWLTIRGAGFVPGSKVVLFHDEGRYEIPNKDSQHQENRTEFVNSSQIKVNVTLYPPGPWKAQVINPDGAESNVFDFAVAVGITSIEPRCPPRRDDRQWITLWGAGFVSGSRVILRHGEGTYWIPDGPEEDRTKFVSATQIDVNVSLRYQGPWSAQVKNPDGRESNMYRFGVGLAVTHVRPSVPKPSSDKQTLTIYGGGFVQGSQAILRYEQGTSPAQTVNSTFVSCREMKVDVYLRDRGLWSVQVRNPDGAESNVHYFPCGFAVTHIVPSSPVVGTNAQEIAIGGGGFDGAAKVWFTHGSGRWLIPPDRTSFKNSYQINVMAKLIYPGEWGVQVENPGGSLSNVLEFTVREAVRTSFSLYSIEPALTTTIDSETGDFVLSWDGVGLQPYIVEASDDLETWYEASDVIVPFTDGPVFWRDVDSVWFDRRFYRLLLFTD